MQNPSVRQSVYALALTLLTAAVFWPALSGGFLFDDYSSIVNQEKVHAESLDLESLRNAASSYHGVSARPIATISFAVDHALWGLNPKGYKLTNLAVHLLNALLVFVLTQKLLDIGTTRKRKSALTAFIIATAWAAHPLQVSTVQYVVQRMEMMSLTFVLLGLVLYLHGRNLQISGERGWKFIALACAAAATGLLAKETAVLFPAYTLALELTLLRFSAASPTAVRRWRAGYTLAATAGLGVFALAVVPHYFSPDAFAMRDYGPGERVLTQLRILPMYLGWILLPQPENYVFYYDHVVASRGLLTPSSTLIGGLFLLALAAAAWVVRRATPLASLGVLWFFASHLLSSNIAPLELAFEHRNYFSVFGIVLVIAAFVLRIPAGSVPTIRTATILISLGGLMLLTLIRSATWGDPLILAKTLAENNPNSARASMDLGEQYMILAKSDPDSRFYDLAREEFERGSRAPNASPMPEQGLLVLAATAGLAAEPEWWDRVVEKLNRRAVGPQEHVMIMGLLELREQGLPIDDRRLAEAYAVLLERAKLPPSHYYLFAEHTLTHLGNEARALSILRAGIENGDAEFAAAVVEKLHQDGHPTLAKKIADHARRIGLADISIPDQRRIDRTNIDAIKDPSAPMPAPP